jgi:hypothetical protein
MFSWPRNQLEVSGQLHAPAAFFAWRERQYSLDRRLIGPQNRYERCGEKNILALAGIRTVTPLSYCPQPVAMPTVTSRLHHTVSICYVFLRVSRCAARGIGACGSDRKLMTNFGQKLWRKAGQKKISKCTETWRQGRSRIHVAQNRAEWEVIMNTTKACLKYLRDYVTPRVGNLME